MENFPKQKQENESLKPEKGLQERFVDSVELPHSNDTNRYTVTPDFAAGFENVLEEFYAIQPDPVLRPEGSTTIFTTAGIQHLETRERAGEVLGDEKFFIAQPVIRSQFMDKVREGYSTAFIQDTYVHTGATVEDFLAMCKSMVSRMTSEAGDAPRYIDIHPEADKWGDKKIEKLVVTLYGDTEELCEGVYIEKYPYRNTSLSIAEVCWSKERIRLLTSENEDAKYFPEFFSLYKKSADKDEVARIIDPLRTAVLMLMQGVRPEHKDPGFRLRGLIRRFAERSVSYKLSVPSMLATASEYWKEHGVDSRSSDKDIEDTMHMEIVRAYNSYILHQVRARTGLSMNVDVSLPHGEFIKRIKSSKNKDAVLVAQEVYRKIYE